MRDTGHVAAVVQQHFSFGQGAVHAQAVARGKVALRLTHCVHVGYQAAAYMGGAFIDI